MSAASEIRELSTGEILEALDDAKQELFNLRFQQEVGQLEDPTRIKIVKRSIARLKTVLHERQLAAQVVQEEGSTNAE
jgi:large subunit ribosomal protein L29